MRKMAILLINLMVINVGFLSGCNEQTSEEGTAPIINSFTATPTVIDSGNASVLNWSVDGATNISINNGVGNVTPSDTCTVYPTVTRTYILTASNSNGTTNASVTVSVYIKIANESYTIDEIFLMTKSRTVVTSYGENYSGVALDDLINQTGIDCPSCHYYTIIGADNYEKTVTWENMQHGVFTKDGAVAFSDLTKAYRIKNIVKIEAVELKL
jgi:hypothetical protein